MKRRTLLAGGAVALAGCSDVLEGPEPETAETLIREGINDARAAAGLARLPMSESIRTAARAHSRDMAERDYYAHETPDGVGPTGRVGCRAGENIHRAPLGEVQNPDSSETWYTYETAELAGFVVEGWTLSDGHYRIMTDRRWQAVGVGVAIDDAEDQFFATADFC